MLAFNALALAASGADGAGAARRIVVLGDSIAAGYGLAESEAFPDRLEAALRAAGVSAEVVSEGVSGDTSAGGLARLERAVGAEPDLVIVELGGNDALRGLDPASVERNLDAIIGRLRAEGVAVLLAGMRAPPNMGREYAQEFETLYRDLAEKHRVRLYPFILDGVAAVPELNQADGIHPNRAGVDVIVARILPHVRAELERARGGGPGP
ncbi:MAG: arylesterase [Alphaproteobacteria bacterium]